MDYKLRPWNLNDLDSLVRYAGNEKIASNMMDRFPYPYSKEDGLQFINMAMQQPPMILAIEINNEAAGGIGLHPQADVYCKNAELGYWLAEPYWGQGIITAAIIEMVDYGFRKLPVERIFARPFGRNTASQKALQKAGFQLEARFEKTVYKNGVFEDEMVYAIRRPR